MRQSDRRALTTALAQGIALPDALRDLSNLLTRVRTPVDAKLRGLAVLNAELSSTGVQAVRLGLSRQIRTTREDARNVISQWESRDSACCFNQSVEALLSLTDTYVMAVSYKHVEQGEWTRKGESYTAKMSDSDQEALVNVVEGCSNIPDVKHVILWCDQVISTRLKDEGKENSLGWYNAGLLPYACFPVLKLSSYISDEVLESRVWLKAERSLGRLAWGTLEVHDAIHGLLGDVGVFNPLSKVIQSIARMVLSGYWPKDMGYWENDYLQMKKWAISVLANMKVVVQPPIFDEIKAVDNLEILSIMDVLVHIPKGLRYAEKPMHTDDRLFFLKVTAWNISVEDIWNFDDKTVSHYMGNIAPFFKFTWWANESKTLIFGYLRGSDMGTAVLAVEDGRGYVLHRMDFDPILYSHADKYPSEKALVVLEQVKNRFSIALNRSQKWSLLYSSSDDKDAVYTDPYLRQGLEAWPTRVDCLVPAVYVGLTTKLYRCAVAKQNNNRAVARRFLQILDSWNRHIRDKYERHISVIDTLAGAIWLEGFSEDRVTFGFYDYMTRFLILGERNLSQFTVLLPSKWEFVQEVRRIAASSTKDVQILVDEVFGSATESNCNEIVSLRDVACFMARGGLTASMNGPQLGSFLCRVASHRGYWATRIYAREGKMQIIFISHEGHVRVAQRKTALPEFHSFGIVRPKDKRAIFEVTVPVEDDPEEYRMYLYWKSMESNTSRHELQTVFVNSVYAVHEGQNVLLVDMSVIQKGEERSVIDVEKITSSVDETEGCLLQLFKGMTRSEQTEPRSEQRRDRGGSSVVDEAASDPNILTEESAEQIMHMSRRAFGMQDNAQAILAEFAQRQRRIQTRKDQEDQPRRGQES